MGGCIQSDFRWIGRKGICGISSAGAGMQQRTIVVEFDSYDIAMAAHKSEAYQKALQTLGSGAERDYRIVEGG